MNTSNLVAGIMVLLLAVSCALPTVRVLEDPLTGEEHLSLGVAYEARGEFDLAIAQYELARRGGIRSRAELFLGNAWFGKGELSAAEKHYRAALDSDPRCGQALNNLAWLMVERGGDLAEAENLARQAVGISLASGDEAGTAAYRDTLEKIMERRRASGTAR